MSDVKVAGSGEATRLRFFPVSWFATVMGVAGMALAWEKATSVFGLGIDISGPLTALAALLFGVLVVAYAAKVIVHPDAVMAELRHPVKISFFPTISIALVLLGTATLHRFPELSFWLWAVGALVHLLLTLYVMGVWVNHEHFEIQHLNPAWFIPVVGNILIPIAGVRHGFVELSWFYFSVGLLFWLVLFAVILYRVIFHSPMPARLVPTLFILIAPPAVGFLAYYALTGEVDAFARVLYHGALFLTLFLVTQAARFGRLKFFLSWWAYSFPLAAITVATLLYHAQTGTAAMAWIGGGLLALSSAVVLMLLGRTTLAVARGEVCVEEG